jgi:hypothetical protein
MRTLPRVWFLQRSRKDIRAGALEAVFSLPPPAMAEAAPMPRTYDRVFHGGARHAFFVQGSAAHHAGWRVSEEPFVAVDSEEAWQGYWAYTPEAGCMVKSEEAFAYSCCYSGALLVAVRLASREEQETKEWMILSADLSERGLTVGGCEGLFSGKPLKPGTADHASILPHLRPHQSLEVTLSWRDAAGDAAKSGFSVEHVELKWSECQRTSLRAFLGGHSGLPWRAKVEAALTGRADAFPELGICEIQDAMVVHKRVVWKQSRKEDQVPYEVQLTFVVFCRFEQDPNKIWSRRVRHDYNPVPGETCLWTLAPDDRVRGALFSEWKQVGCGSHHVLSVSEKVDPRDFAPLPAVRLGVVPEARVDLFEGGAGRWAELWRVEDLKADRKESRYWSKYRYETSGAIEIDDVAYIVDVESIVEGQFFRLDGHLATKAKSEALKDQVKEKEVLGEAKKAVAAEFLDPYVEVCREQLSKLDGKAEEPRGEKRGREEQQWYGGAAWNWKGSSWNKRGCWQGDDWARSRTTTAVVPPPPPPPAAPRTQTRFAAPFCHLSRAVPFVYGDAAAEDRLRPLVDLRRILETHGVAFEGRVPDFVESVQRLVWDCLPHLADDASFGQLLEEGLRECGIQPLANLGLSLESLSVFGRADVHAVFDGFSPGPVRLRSDFGTLSCVPVDPKVVERLAAWSWWLTALESPGIELLKACLKELPVSLAKATCFDSRGYHMPLLRASDLQLFSAEGGDAMAGCLLEDLKEGVRRLAASTFHGNGSWWPTALLNACRWSVQHMNLPQGKVDLEVLGRYFQMLNGVSRQFRKEALDLIVSIRDSERHGRHGRVPQSFDLGRVEFRHAESVTIASLAAPKWPFE